jgi:hypothetical protein
MSRQGRKWRPSVRLAVLVVAAVTSWGLLPNDDGIVSAQQASTTSAIKHVFVIAMENTDANQIYGKPNVAPYINTKLMPAYAWSTNFHDELPLPVPRGR